MKSHKTKSVTGRKLQIYNKIKNIQMMTCVVEEKTISMTLPKEMMLLYDKMKILIREIKNFLEQMKIKT